MPNNKDMSLWAYVKTKIRPLAHRAKESAGPLSQFGNPAVTGGGGVLSPLPVPTCIDLHGDTIQTAHERTRKYLHRAFHAGYASVVIVTGRSGGICQEFPHWIALHPKARRAEALNGGGAFRVTLIKRPSGGRG